MSMGMKILYLVISGLCIATMSGLLANFIAHYPVREFPTALYGILIALFLLPFMLAGAVIGFKLGGVL